MIRRFGTNNLVFCVGNVRKCQQNIVFFCTVSRAQKALIFSSVETLIEHLIKYLFIFQLRVICHLLHPFIIFMFCNKYLFSL